MGRPVASTEPARERSDLAYLCGIADSETASRLDNVHRQSRAQVGLVGLRMA